MREIKTTHIVLLLVVCATALSLFVDRKPEQRVVVYTALDRSFSEPIFELFEQRTGIAVEAVYDNESTKTVGLASRIREERVQPRCDVFWNNEILHTLRLKAAGALEAFAPDAASSFPEQYRDAERYWHGFAARARVLIVNTDLLPDAAFPSSVEDLADPRYRGRTAIAKPLFGTTASHLACLWVTRGADEATELLESLKANDIQVCGGNKGVARAVAAGSAAFGLTDTDDAIIELEAGKPVRLVYPDSEADASGTLFLPNTLALVKNAPHRAGARTLISFLLSPEVEQLLAAGPSAQIPLHRDSKPGLRVKGPTEVKALRVDFEQAAEAFDAARDLVEKRFLD